MKLIEVENAKLKAENAKWKTDNSEVMESVKLLKQSEIKLLLDHIHALQTTGLQCELPSR